MFLLSSPVVASDVAPRAAFGMLAALCTGGVQVVSLYLHHGEGLSDRNWQILLTVGEALRSLGAPFILAGYFNMDPEVIAATPWVKKLKATVLAPPKGSHTYVSGEHRSLIRVEGTQPGVLTNGGNSNPGSKSSGEKVAGSNGGTQHSSCSHSPALVPPGHGSTNVEFSKNTNYC